MYKWISCQCKHVPLAPHKPPIPGPTHNWHISHASLEDMRTGSGPWFVSDLRWWRGPPFQLVLITFWLVFYLCTIAFFLPHESGFSSLAAAATVCGLLHVSHLLAAKRLWHFVVPDNIFCFCFIVSLGSTMMMMMRSLWITIRVRGLNKRRSSACISWCIHEV